MPSNREIRKLLRPLLQRRSDLREHQRAVFFVPLTHYLRGAIFVQGWSSPAFTVWSFAMQLYDGIDQIDFGIARSKKHRDYSAAWRNDWETTSLDLCAYIEGCVLPIVQPMTTPREHERLPAYVHNFYDDPFTSPMFTFRAAVGACFDGKFDLAERLTASVSPPIFPAGRRGSTKYNWDFHRRARHLLKLLRTDRSRVPKLLHDWEAFTVKSCGLEKFWTATPFPCDLKTKGQGAG